MMNELIHPFENECIPEETGFRAKELKRRKIACGFPV